MYYLLLLFLMFTIKNIDAAAGQSNVLPYQGLDLRPYSSLHFYPQNHPSTQPFTLILDALRMDRQGTFRETFSQLPSGQNPTIFVKKDEQTGKNQVFTEPTKGTVAYTCHLFVNPVQTSTQTGKPKKKFQLKPSKKEFVPKNKQFPPTTQTTLQSSQVSQVPANQQSKSSADQDKIQKIALRIATENLTPEQRTALVLEINQLLLKQGTATGADSTPVVTPAAQPASTGNQPPISFSFLGPVDPAIAAEEEKRKAEIAAAQQRDSAPIIPSASSNIQSPTTAPAAPTTAAAASSKPSTTYVPSAGPTAAHKSPKKTDLVATKLSVDEIKDLLNVDVDPKDIEADPALIKQAQKELENADEEDDNNDVLEYLLNDELEKEERAKKEKLKVEEERRKAEIAAQQRDSAPIIPSASSNMQPATPAPAAPTASAAAPSEPPTTYVRPAGPTAAHKPPKPDPRPVISTKQLQRKQELEEYIRDGIPSDDLMDMGFTIHQIKAAVERIQQREAWENSMIEQAEQERITQEKLRKQQIEEDEALARGLQASLDVGSDGTSKKDEAQFTVVGSEGSQVAPAKTETNAERNKRKRESQKEKAAQKRAQEAEAAQKAEEAQEAARLAKIEKEKAEIAAAQEEALQQVLANASSDKARKERLERLTLAGKLEPKDSKKEEKQEEPDTEIEPENNGADSAALEKEKKQKEKKQKEKKEKQERRMLAAFTAKADQERAALPETPFTENPKTEDQAKVFMRELAKGEINFDRFKMLFKIMKSTQFSHETKVNAARMLITHDHTTFGREQKEKEAEYKKKAVALGVELEDPLLMLEKARQHIEEKNMRKATDLLKDVKQIIDEAGQTDESATLKSIYNNLTRLLEIETEKNRRLLEAEIAKLKQPPAKRFCLLETKKLLNPAGIAETIIALSEKNHQARLEEDPTMTTLLGLLTEEEKAMIKTYYTCLKGLRESAQSLQDLHHFTKKTDCLLNLLTKKLSENNLQTICKSNIPELLALYTTLSKRPEVADDTPEHAQANKKVLEGLMLVLQCIENIKLQLLQKLDTGKTTEIYLQSLDTLTTAVTNSENGNGFTLLMLNDNDERLQQLALQILNQKMQRAEYTLQNVKDFHSVHHLIEELRNFLIESNFAAKENFLERLRMLESDYVKKDTDERKEEIQQTLQEIPRDAIDDESHAALSSLVEAFNQLPEDSTPVAKKISWQNLFCEALKLYNNDPLAPMATKERIVHFILKLINATSTGYKIDFHNFFSYFFELIKDNKIPLEKAIYLLHSLNKAVPVDCNKINQQEILDHLASLSKEQIDEFKRLSAELKKLDEQAQKDKD